MKIMISPAKNMRVDTDMFDEAAVPSFIEETKRLHEILKGYSFEELKHLFAANDNITRLNYGRYQEMKLEECLTPAVLSYVGLQYQSMAPGVFTKSQWDYVKQNLVILSGFYGILGACDGVVPYRLEMQAKLPVDGCRDLYEFWGDKLYQGIMDREEESPRLQTQPRKGEESPRLQTQPWKGIIINLASKEYSKAVEPYIEPDTRFISCVFAEEKNGKTKVKATAAKMARGQMVRWMAEHQIGDPEGIKKFDESGYRYSEEMSSDSQWVFIRSV